MCELIPCMIFWVFLDQALPNSTLFRSVDLPTHNFFFPWDICTKHNEAKNHHIRYKIHTQLFGSKNSWNLNEDSPAVSRCNLRSACSLVTDGSSGGRGSIWLSLGWWANLTSGGNGKTDGEGTRNRALPKPWEISDWSHRKTCIRIGTLACRCSESFWLRETVSKHRTAPVEETIHGRTFWFDTLETTSSLDALIDSLYRVLSPDLVEGTFSSPSITDDI